jgi:hypothetical protein
VARAAMVAKIATDEIEEGLDVESVLPNVAG